jgi:hypothetical protein
VFRRVIVSVVGVRLVTISRGSFLELLWLTLHLISLMSKSILSCLLAVLRSNIRSPCLVLLRGLVSTSVLLLGYLDLLNLVWELRSLDLSLDRSIAVVNLVSCNGYIQLGSVSGTQDFDGGK